MCVTGAELSLPKMALVALCAVVAMACCVGPAAATRNVSNAANPFVALDMAHGLEPDTPGAGKLACSRNCAVCSSNGACSACGNKKVRAVDF